MNYIGLNHLNSIAALVHGKIEMCYQALEHITPGNIKQADKIMLDKERLSKIYHRIHHLREELLRGNEIEFTNSTFIKTISIMKIAFQDRVIPYELAEVLFRQGIDLPTLFYWSRYRVDKETTLFVFNEIIDDNHPNVPAWDVYDLGYLFNRIKASDLAFELLKVEATLRSMVTEEVMYNPSVLGHVLLRLLNNNHTTVKEINNIMESWNSRGKVGAGLLKKKGVK